MHVDVLLDPFGARWSELRDGALAAADAGFDGIWLYDHLAGSVHRTSRVVEGWTTLTAIAALVPDLAIGPMVLNVANRDPAMLAVMAATLQEVSGGRLLLGIGAGGGTNTPYAAEQPALGRPVPGDAVRRRAVEDAVATVRTVWSGTVGGVEGFLRPDPAPPVIIGGFGPRMAELAGRVGDGMNAPAGRHLRSLIEIAREAHQQSGRDPARFVVTASGAPTPDDRARLEELGVDRLVVRVGPPYTDAIGRAAAMAAS